MLVLYIIIGICILFQAERGIFDTLSYLRLFGLLKQKSFRLAEKRKLYVLIPVLREQSIVEETVLQFFEMQAPFEIQVAVVTTVKESLAKKGEESTTGEIVAHSMKSGKLSQFKNRIHIFQDSDMRGNMATQLNYALQKIRAASPADTLYIVYNADSAVSPTTFEKLSGLLVEHPGKEFAFQQPCAYVKDMNPASGSFLNALSLYQSWYCLGHESRLVSAYEKASAKRDSAFLGVIVGHGSGMTLGMHAQNGGYPAELLTEDLTFGFILSANNARIMLLPALEVADVPARLTAFIRQKSVWFWNYLGYLDCYKALREKKYPASRLLILLLHGIGAGAYWFFSAIFILAPILLGAILQSPIVLFVSIASYMVFCILPQYVLFKKLPFILHQQGFDKTALNVKAVSFLKILPSLCLITVADSVGPWIATSRCIAYFFTGKLPEKPKTED